MKKTYVLFITIFLSVCGIANAQYGIGTATPDASSILDLSSTSKGLLMPRMTTVQQTALVNPAIGLTVFNTTTGQLETNKGDGLGGASWSGGSGGTSGSGGAISVVESGTQVATVLDSDTAISEMTLSPGAGTYAVTFNGEYSIDPGNVASFITTPKGVVDLLAAYSQLNAMVPTITTHSPAFGLNEILTPGVYSVNANATIAGNLYLNGNGNSNSLFIFKINGALGAGVINIFLSNGAEARNIFWVTEGAISIGANSTVKGNFLSHGFAVAMGTASILEGRLLSTIGAITTNASTINAPLRNSVVNLGILSAFSLFTSSGAVENTGVSFVTGHVGSNVGAITGFTETLDSKVFGPSTPPYPIDNSIFATFSVYQNNILIPTSTRTVISKVFKSDVITVLSKATITAGQSIDIRWNTTLGTLSLVNKTLTLMKIK
jgi:hypothetical protein